MLVCPKIQASDFVIHQHDVVGIDLIFIALDLL